MQVMTQLLGHGVLPGGPFWAGWTKNRVPQQYCSPCLLQEAHLLPCLGARLPLQDLRLPRAPLQPRVRPLQGDLLQVMEQGEPRPLRPHCLQHRAPLVGVLGPQAWLLPLLEPNSGK